MNELDRLQSWYAAQCDGQWEHQHGVEIGTLDNPGWRVEIDGLRGNLRSQEIDEQESPESWIKCSLANGMFKGYCSPSRLGRIIELFFAWIEDDSA
jgi:hypothetical protein